MKNSLKIGASKFCKLGYGLLLMAIVFTTAVLVYAAQPWSDNYAYKNLSGYLTLLGFILWAVSPYGMLTLILYRCRNHPTAIAIAFIGTLIIVMSAAAVMVDAFFIHLDAQGSLVIIFLPLYQWLAVLLVFVVSLVMGSLSGKSH